MVSFSTLPFFFILWTVNHFAALVQGQETCATDDGTLRQRLQNVTRALLDESSPDVTPFMLRSEVMEMKAILLEAASASVNSFSLDDTRTDNGLALAPEWAAQCIDDYVRTITFIRGIHQAIQEVLRMRQESNDETPIRVLYAGSGPLAPLAIPLLSLFSQNEIVYTILDIHEASVASVKRIVHSLRLGSSVIKVERTDAASYQILDNSSSIEHLPDIIVCEVMQEALEDEPQVAVTRNLLRQVPDETIFIPKDIQIKFAMVVGETGDEEKRLLNLGTAFQLNKETVTEWKQLEAGVGSLPGQVLSFPSDIDVAFEPAILTEVQVYGDHILTDNQSGVTVVRVGGEAQLLERNYQPGDMVRFYYQLGDKPGLRAELHSTRRANWNRAPAGARKRNLP